jgi:hypothetical protein
MRREIRTGKSKIQTEFASRISAIIGLTKWLILLMLEPRPAEKPMKRTTAAVIFGVFLFVGFTATTLADPGIVGDTVSLSRQIPSTGFIFGPFVFQAQAGPADTVALSTGNNLYVNVEDSSLLFTFGPSSGSGGPYTPLQHFILFQDLSPTAPVITAVTYETDLPGFVASDLLFTAHTITVGEGGLNYSGGQHLTVNLHFVPEPNCFALVGVGTAMMTLRRRGSNV